MSKTGSQGLINHYALPLAELGYSPKEAESMMDHKLYNALSSYRANKSQPEMLCTRPPQPQN